MMIQAVVTPPPAPVGQMKILLEQRYFVIRGDGHIAWFSSLHDKASGSASRIWNPPGQAPFHANSMSTNEYQSPSIDIPLDMFTAMRLGLVTFEELLLPEGFKALLNLIK